LAKNLGLHAVTKGLPMSVIIVFPDGTDWFKANWVFRQLARDVSDRYSSDAEVCKAVEVAEAIGALDLKEMNDGLRRRVMEALTTVATDTIKGIIAGWRPHNEKEHALYCEAISELTKCLEGRNNIGASSG
jgi:hypothetical protein